MKTLPSILLLSLMGLMTPAFASELDNEASVTNQQIAAAKDLPATLVIRVDNATNAMSVLHSNVALDAATTSLDTVRTAAFTDMKPNERMRTELDRDGSKSSWFFFINPFYLTNPFYFTPTYLYNGYAFNYTPYYTYYTPPVTYYYYRWWF